MTDKPLATRLSTTLERWRTIFPNGSTIPDPLGFLVPADEVVDWFERGIFLLNRLESDETALSVRAVASPPISAAIDQIDGVLNNATLHGISWAVASGVHRTVLAQLMEVRRSAAWLLPATSEDLSSLPGHLREVVSQAERVAAIIDQSRTSALEADALRTEAGLASKEINDLLLKVQGHEREAGNAQVNAETHASAISTARKDADDLVPSLQLNADTQSNLLQELEDKQSQIEATLQGASKIGLARSFHERRIALERSQKSWAISFFAGLGLLCVGAGILVSLGRVASTATIPDLVVENVSHILLLGPVIWLAWFSARKHGQLSRLAEDYAFKEASALSFVGYRNEMGEDEEMLALLRKTAIDNFGANPARVLQSDEPVSPAHDAITRVLKKTSPDKLADLLKEFLQSARGGTSK